MKYRRYEASPEAVAQARWYGMGGNIALRLSRMARRSAPVTSSYGNRRFNDFILKVVDDQVLGVTRLETPHPTR